MEKPGSISDEHSENEDDVTIQKPVLIILSMIFLAVF